MAKIEGHPTSCGTARVSHRQSAVLDGNEQEKRDVSSESQMHALDINRQDIYGSGEQCKNDVPTAIDKHWLSHPALGRCSLSR